MARGSFPLGNPFSAGGPRMGGSSLAGGPGPADPTNSFNSDAINAALQPYGVQLPTQYQQPGPAENTGWGQRHPGLATGLDNALIAVAGMGPTGETAGENISNAARGILGVGPYRRQFMSEQAMVPFQIAKEVGGLQAQQSYINMQKSMAGYYGDRGQAAIQLNQTRLQTAMMKDNIEAAKELQLGKGPDGKEAVMRYQFNTHTMTGQYVADPNLDPEAFKQQRKMTSLTNIFGADDRGKYIGVQMAEHFGGIDKIPPDPGTWGPKDAKAYADAVASWSRMQPGFMTGMANLQQKRDESWEHQQTSYFTQLVGSMKPPSSADLKSAEDNARKAYMANPNDTAPDKYGRARMAGQAARENMIKEHSQKVADAGQALAEFHELPSDVQDKYGNFRMYYNSTRGGGMPNPTASPNQSPAPSMNPANPAPAAGPQDINSTINQMMGLLAKPKPQ